MKDFFILIRDWADKRHVTIEAMFEENYEVIVYASNIHFQDLLVLNKLDDNLRISFIDPHDEDSIIVRLSTCSRW